MGTNAINAAIDIGTNSILLLIVSKAATTNDHSSTLASSLSLKQPSLTPLIDQAQTVRLGENLMATGLLSTLAMERTIAGLRTYLKIVESYSPTQIFCFGTEALRRAKNTDVFRQRLNQELGLDLRILSPNEEAQYTFQGAVSSLKDTAQAINSLVIDIGGGSTEIVYGNSTTITYQASFPVGAVVAKEVFQLKDNITSTELTTLKRYIQKLIYPLPQITLGSNVLLTGGTATTLAALDQRLTAYSFEAIDGHLIQYSTIQAQYNRLNQLSLRERAALPGMEPGRADIILPAIAILLTLFDGLNINIAQISVRGARYGLLLE